MKYQDCGAPAQAPEGRAAGRADTCLSDANINPRTGLASDYLNHFNEAIMLLEMLPACPECRDDFLDWRPVSYREHFAGSRFKGRDLAIAAYENAEPGLRQSFDALTSAMTAVLQATRAAMQAGLPPDAASRLAERAAICLRPLVARTGAVINGEPDAARGEPSAPQAVVDGLMQRSA